LVDAKQLNFFLIINGIFNVKMPLFFGKTVTGVKMLLKVADMLFYNKAGGLADSKHAPQCNLKQQKLRNHTFVS